MKVLIVGSKTTTKGGISTVIKQQLRYISDEFSVKFIGTTTDKSIIYKVFLFIHSFIKYIFVCLFWRPDIIHLHVSQNGSFIRKKTLFYFKNRNSKVILQHHGSEFIDIASKMKKNKFKKIERFINNVNINLVLGKYRKNIFDELFPMSNVQVLYNGIEKNEYQYNNNGNIILFLGALINRKGIYDLIESIKLSIDFIDKKYIFVFCGNGNIDSIRKIIENANLSERIILKGWINDKEKNEIFKNTIINILPSYNEGLPMSILETMSYGIPNISTKIASIPEVINDTNGLLITPGDIDELSKEIVYLTKSEELRLKFSINSYETINNQFSINDIINKLEEIYKKIGV